MPINEPNYLTPSGSEDEKTFDALKCWLSGDTSEVDFDAASTVELVTAAFAAVYHLAFDLLTYGDDIVHQALTEERYGPMEITHGGEGAVDQHHDGGSEGCYVAEEADQEAGESYGEGEGEEGDGVCDCAAV
ncbi:hypothetical protein LTR74_010477 [Friedmanniomyces endolithicus]|nr:hypothetical protein LTR74_010477 [Friedmanniomyces endolithicus]